MTGSPFDLLNNNNNYCRFLCDVCFNFQCYPKYSPCTRTQHRPHTFPVQSTSKVDKILRFVYVHSKTEDPLNQLDKLLFPMPFPAHRPAGPPPTTSTVKPTTWSTTMLLLDEMFYFRHSFRRTSEKCRKLAEHSSRTLS